jgi:hypothetical protein
MGEMGGGGGGAGSVAWYLLEGSNAGIVKGESREMDIFYFFFHRKVRTVLFVCVCVCM